MLCVQKKKKKKKTKKAKGNVNETKYFNKRKNLTRQNI